MNYVKKLKFYDTLLICINVINYKKDKIQYQTTFALAIILFLIEPNYSIFLFAVSILISSWS